MRYESTADRTPRAAGALSIEDVFVVSMLVMLAVLGVVALILQS